MHDWGGVVIECVGRQTGRSDSRKQLLEARVLQQVVIDKPEAVHGVCLAGARDGHCPCVVLIRHRIPPAQHACCVHLQLYLFGEPRGRVRLRLVEQRSVQVVKAGRGVSDALDPVEGVAQGRPAAHAREQVGDGDVRAVADGIGGGAT